MSFAISLSEWELINIKGDAEDIQKVKDKTGLGLDSIMLKAQPALSQCELNARLLRVLRDDSAHPQYLELSRKYKMAFDSAYKEFSKLLDISTMPLKQQVRIQCGLVLAGLMV